jgi:hypothetical protein
MESSQSLIAKKLTQGPAESKKAVYAFIGGLTVLLILISSLAAIHLHPEIAKEIVELVNTAILFYAAVITMLITGQAAFDWKAVTALQHLDETQSIQSSRDSSFDVQSNQPIGNVDLSESAPSPEVVITGRRSPKDFISRDVAF